MQKAGIVSALELHIERRAASCPCIEWRQVDVSGDHLSMLREPFVADTAKVLSEELDALEERRAGQTAVYPPSMTRTDPVTKDDAGVAR